jgi:integrase
LKRAFRHFSKPVKAWRNEKHRAQWKSTLKFYAYPVMGSFSVKDVEGNHILQALKPVWQREARSRATVAGSSGKRTGLRHCPWQRDGENPARWKGHLSHLLGKVGDRTVKHHAAMPFKSMPGFIDALKEREGVGARALELTILTARSRADGRRA